jgi:hypothetical protein
MYYFPDSEDPVLQPFTRAFLRLMFAHAAFEQRTRELLAVIDPDLSDECVNWSARARPKETKKLIAESLDKHRGGISEGEEIVRFLTQAIPLCDERNLLAHGTWWSFDTKAQTITVRAGRNRYGEKRHQKRRCTDIEQTAIAFKEIETELDKIQRKIETRRQQAPD